MYLNTMFSIFAFQSLSLSSISIISDPGLNIVNPPDFDPVEPEEEEPTWTGVLPEGKGASWEFAFGRLQCKVKDPRKYQHDRWKLEFLMDYTPAKDGLICMVCGATLMNPKISTVKMHIQQKHPDTTYLSDQEKAVVMEEWEQKMAAGNRAAGQQHGEDEICIEINGKLTVCGSIFNPDDFCSMQCFLVTRVQQNSEFTFV